MTCGKSIVEQLEEVYRGYKPKRECKGEHHFHFHPPTDTMRCIRCFTPMGWKEKNRRLEISENVARENKFLWAILRDCGIAEAVKPEEEEDEGQSRG